MSLAPSAFEQTLSPISEPADTAASHLLKPATSAISWPSMTLPPINLYSVPRLFAVPVEA